MIQLLGFVWIGPTRLHRDECALCEHVRPPYSAEAVWFILLYTSPVTEARKPGGVLGDIQA